MASTMTEVAMPAAVMNGMPAKAMPRTAMTTVPPAKITVWPAVATARPAGLRHGQALRQELAVPGDEEQGVVDAHAEGDHGGHLRRPAGDVDDARHQCHRADADREAERGRCRWAGPSR